MDEQERVRIVLRVMAKTLADYSEAIRLCKAAQQRGEHAPMAVLVDYTTKIHGLLGGLLDEQRALQESSSAPNGSDPN